MYLVNVTDVNGILLSFECQSLTESYDNAVKRRELTFVKKVDLDSFISGFSPLEEVGIASIEVEYEGQVIATYTDYKVYHRTSIEYPENNPKDAQGVAHFTVE